MTENPNQLIKTQSNQNPGKEPIEQKIKRITRGLFTQIKTGCYRTGPCYNKYCRKSPSFAFQSKSFQSDKDIVIEAIQLSKDDYSEFYLCNDYRPAELAVQWKSNVLPCLDDWTNAFNFHQGSARPDLIEKLLLLPGARLGEFLDPAQLATAVSKGDFDIFEEVINFNSSMSKAIEVIERQVNLTVKRNKPETRHEPSDLDQIFIDNIKQQEYEPPKEATRKVSLDLGHEYHLSGHPRGSPAIRYLLNANFKFVVFLMANPSVYYNDSYKKDLSQLFENFSFLASLVDRDFMSRHFLLYVAYPKLFTEVISNFQNYLTILLCALTRTKFTSTKEIRHLIGFLRTFEVFHHANQWLGSQGQFIQYGELKGFVAVGKGLVPKEEFHNDSVNNYLSIKIQCANYFKYYFKPSETEVQRERHIAQGYLPTRVEREADFDKEAEFFSFIKYFFLYDAANKNDIIKIYNLKEQTSEMTSSLNSINSILSGLGGIYLIFDVRRENLIEDTLNIIIKSNLNFKKPLKVKFRGEQGVDEGGVKKEFFMLLIRQLFEVDYGMFTYNEVSR